MHDQAQAWGRVARKYDELFVDPYDENGDNPVLRSVSRLKGKSSLVVGDFGCGTGPFLPRLARQFKQVVAVDFSKEMLAEARQRCKEFKNISFYQLPFDQLQELPVKVDLAVSMNSLVSHDVGVLDRALAAFRVAIRKTGRLYGIVPSLEGLHYHVMLLTDLGLHQGMTLAKAQAFAAQKAELHGYDLNSATFTFDRIKQHLWLREEVQYRLNKAGYHGISVRKAGLPWDQFAEGKTLIKQPQSWDWAFRASP